MITICTKRVPENEDEEIKVVKKLIEDALNDNNVINVRTDKDGTVSPRLIITISTLKIRGGNGVTKLHVNINMIKVAPDFFCDTYHKDLFIEVDKVDPSEVTRIISKTCISLLTADKSRRRKVKDAPKHKKTTYSILKRSTIINNADDDSFEVNNNNLSQSSQIITSGTQVRTTDGEPSAKKDGAKLDWSQI